MKTRMTLLEKDQRAAGGFRCLLISSIARACVTCAQPLMDWLVGRIAVRPK
jgi:hypothetical protein